MFLLIVSMKLSTLLWIVTTNYWNFARKMLKVEHEELTECLKVDSWIWNIFQVENECAPSVPVVSLHSQTVLCGRYRFVEETTSGRFLM